MNDDWLRRQVAGLALAAVFCVFLLARAPLWVFGAVVVGLLAWPAALDTTRRAS